MTWQNSIHLFIDKIVTNHIIMGRQLNFYTYETLLS